MSTPKNAKAGESPTSFQFYIAPSQAVCYPGSSATPKKGTGLAGTLICTELDDEFLRPWFKQCLIPLVGEKAVGALYKVLEADRVRKDVDEFWDQTRQFLKNLK